MTRMIRGFTMLEVIVVVVVIGILAAMVIPRFANAQSTTATATAAEDLRRIAGAIELYQGVNGSFPPNASRAEDAAILDTYFKNESPFEIQSSIGGVYDYENTSTVAVVILQDGANQYTHEDALALDVYMDDGDLTTGRLQEVGNSLRYRFGEIN